MSPQIGRTAPDRPGAGRPSPTTPDGRYVVVRGRLWRRSDPALSGPDRERLVAELMTARRAVGTAKRRQDAGAEGAAHAEVDRVKRAFGERGPVWWDDGAPDLNRHLVRTTSYAGWYAASGSGDPESRDDGSSR